MKLRGAVALLLVCGCAAGARPPSGPAAAPSRPPAGKAPFDAAPSATARIDIAIDAKAAREILSSLARLKPEISDVKVLEDMPAVRVAIQFGSNLNDHGVDATVVIEPGRHDWVYWRRGLIEIAEWHGKQFAYD